MSHMRNIYSEADWEAAEGYPTGTKVKTLRDEDGAKTILLDLPKGFRLESHAHLYNEQHLVLSGEYESGGEVFPSSTYRLIHAGKDHGPFTSKTGAIILIIWDPVK